MNIGVRSAVCKDFFFLSNRRIEGVWSLCAVERAFFFFLHASLSYECQGRISIGLSCSWEEIKMLFLLIFVFMFLVHIWGCCWIKPSTAIFAFFLHMCRKRAPNTSGADVTFHWSKCRAWLACRVVSRLVDDTATLTNITNCMLLSLVWHYQ